MFYKLLGILVWNGGKVLLRQKYGRTYMPKRVFAGIVLVAVGAAALHHTRHSSDS